MMRNGIVCAGNWILDCVKTLDRWPGEGNLCNILREERSGGGGPCNVLFDLAAMKTKLPLYAAGRIGCDSEGELLAEQAREYGIDSTFLTLSRTAPTAHTDVMSHGGRRTFFYCPGANAELTCDHLMKIDVPAKFFYLGYLMLLPSLDAPDPGFGTGANRILHTMRQRGFKTVVDMVSEAPEKFRRTVRGTLPYVDILIINELEAGCCLEQELRLPDGSLNGDALFQAPQKLLDAGVGELAVIHFPEGAVAQKKGEKAVYEPSCAIRREEIAGSNGAGDAFCAGVLYALHENRDLRETLRFAGACSFFNLRSATASGGAVSLETLQTHLRGCEYSEIPDSLKRPGIISGL